jgi:hypothetical protein
MLPFSLAAMLPIWTLQNSALVATLQSKHNAMPQQLLCIFATLLTNTLHDMTNTVDRGQTIFKRPFHSND